jgi:hypothetical protein
MHDIDLDNILMDSEPNMDVNVSTILERPPAIDTTKQKRFMPLKIMDTKRGYRNYFVPLERKARNAHVNPFKTYGGPARHAK